MLFVAPLQKLIMLIYSFGLSFSFSFAAINDLFPGNQESGTDVGVHITVKQF